MARKNPPADPRWTSELEPAPGDLRIVHAFLNTDPESELGEARAFTAWLERWGLLPPDTEIGAAELEQARAARQDLRALIVGPNARDAALRLDEALTPARARIRCGDDGQIRFEVVLNRCADVLARLCAIVETAQTDGTWKRMKVCVHEKCRTVFFDFSANRSAKWCSRRCGSSYTSGNYRRRNLARLRHNQRGDTMVRRAARALQPGKT